MAGGKLGEDVFVNLAKLEFECAQGQFYWFLSEFDLSVGDAVLAPFGKLDEPQKAIVVRFDKHVNSKIAPFDVRKMKYIYKQIK